MSSKKPALARPAIGAVQGELRALSTEIDRLDGLAADRFGLNRTDLRALDLIRSAGVLSPTALAQALGFTTGGVTTVIDRLEQSGYVRRQPDRDDRRRLVLIATDLVGDREKSVFGQLVRDTQALIATYTDVQLETIGDFLRRSREVTAEHSERLAGQARGGEDGAGGRDAST